MSILKSDIINGAYSLTRISGLTVVPGAEDLELALIRLESMAAEWFDRGYDIGYKFTETPDSADPSGIPLAQRYVFELGLASRIIHDFGKQLTQQLSMDFSQGFSGLANVTAPDIRTDYPNRMPRGSGNTLRYNRWQRFYRNPKDAPTSTSTNKMFTEEIEVYTESYVSYLNDGEVISSFTIEAENGLTITSSSLNSASTIIEYTIEADGTNEISSDYIRIEIKVTTSTGRIVKRFIDFKVDDEELSTA